MRRAPRGYVRLLALLVSHCLLHLDNQVLEGVNH